MGYYTNYTLSIAEDRDGNIMRQLRKENSGANYCLTRDGETQDKCKWYTHERDLKEFSKKYPTTLFTLYSEGEESGDIWNKHFLNGKVQICKAKIIFDRYDPAKLEE